ncbi:MAG: DUF3048 domain-containing protein [Candidatus Andersenbacteria bacterium]
MTDQHNKQQDGDQASESPHNNRPKVDLISKAIESSASNSQKINTKTLGIIGGVIILLIIVGLGVYAGLRPSESREDIESRGIFGQLPGSGDKEEEKIDATLSGLSGRTCDGANRRAIGVMMPSDPITRPASGFAPADLVFELPVLVNDVTRLTAVYQCGRPGEIGSARSARHDYLFLAEGVDAILAHWGGSYHALNRIDVGEFQTINALQNPHNAFYRKAGIQAPHNGFTSYDRLWEALQKIGYRTETNFKGYSFKDDIPTDQRIAGGTLSIAWPGAYRVHYEYDPATNRYQRFWAGVKQVDGEDSTPVAPSVVAIMRAANGPAEGPGGYNDVDIEGTGELLLYQDGQEIKGTWTKNILEKKDPVHFLDQQSNPITLTRGQVWIMAVEPSIAVTWEPAGAAAQ